MNEDELAQLAMEIHMLSAITVKKTMLAMENHAALAEAGLSLLQFGVLRSLFRQQYTISELSQLLMVDPSTLVSTVDALERKGLAERGRDPNDRRRVPLSVTERGAQIAACHPFQSPFTARDNLLLTAIEEMGPENGQLLLNLMRELVGHLPDGQETLQRVAERVQLHIQSVSHSSEGV